MKKRVISILICTVMMFGMMTVFAFADTPKIITWTDVYGIESPYAGEYPDYVGIYRCNYEEDDYAVMPAGINPNSNNWKNDILWKDETTGTYLTPGVDTFIEGHTYTVIFHIKAGDGYEFYTTGENNGNDVHSYFNYQQVDNLSTQQFDRLKYLVSEYTFSPCKKRIEKVELNFADIVYNGVISQSNPTANEGVEITKVEWYENEIPVKDTARFKSGRMYAALVYLKAKDGYAIPRAYNNINGVKKDFEIIANGNESLMWCQKSSEGAPFELVTAYFLGYTIDYNVTHVAISSIDTPLTGQTPDFDATLQAGVRLNDIRWYDQNGQKLGENDLFEAGNKYTVEIDISPDSDYSFNITHATINGKVATTTGTSPVTLKYTFDACKGVVNSVNINITPPSIGAKPSYEPTESENGYSINAVSYNHNYEKNGAWWYDVINNKNMLIGGADSKFKAGGVYKVRVTLTPDDGFSFAPGVTAKINGKDAFVESLDNEMINVHFYFNPLVADIPCKNGHSFTTYNSDNNATCCKNGTETAKCDNCIATDTREIKNSALGHTDTSKIFTDVKAGKWYTSAVDYAYTHGFIAGVGATEFGRDVSVTRGMFITILARIAGVDTGKEANNISTKFADVKSGKYYTAAIKWASDNKIVSGLSDTTFGPDAAIERQQLCVMIVNFAKHQGVTLTAAEAEITFKDASSISNYAKAAVKTAQMADIVNGYANGNGFDFRPKNTATRAEAAQILYKFHKDFVAK